MSSYYTKKSGEQYFAKRIKWLDEGFQVESARLFRPYISPSDTVLDFGCGTGGILAALSCSRRIGIEVGESPAKIATANGIEIFQKISDAPNSVADVIITNHALEHVHDPFGVLSELRFKLKTGGRIIVVVPAEKPFHRRNRHWKENPEQHLYSWNSKTLGNLLIATGFKLEKTYYVECGYTKYFSWLSHVPLVFAVIKRVYAFVRSRYHTVCIGRQSS